MSNNARNEFIAKTAVRLTFQLGRETKDVTTRGANGGYIETTETKATLITSADVTESVRLAIILADTLAAKGCAPWPD